MLIPRMKLIFPHYTLHTGSSFPYTLFPLWQVYPIEGNEGAVMFNPKPYSAKTFEDFLTYRIPVLTPTIQLIQDVEPRPSSVLYFPIMNHFPTSQANSSHVLLGFVSKFHVRNQYVFLTISIFLFRLCVFMGCHSF